MSMKGFHPGALPAAERGDRRMKIGWQIGIKVG